MPGGRSAWPPGGPQAEFGPDRLGGSMYKTIWLFRRNPRLTRDEFIDYYETRHSKFVAHMTGVRKYVRRYVRQPEATDSHHSPSFDVIMESWFDDKAACDAALAHITSLDIWADILADEAHLFDKGHAGYAVGAVVDVEHETDLSSPDLVTTYEAAKAVIK
jgi:hypothetical protein